MSKSNIIIGLLLFLTGFALCFYLFNVRVNLGWAPIFEVARLRQPSAYENKDCLQHNWLIDTPGSGFDDKLIDSEFVFCIPVTEKDNERTN